jgi:hypothetical protein
VTWALFGACVAKSYCAEPAYHPSVARLVVKSLNLSVLVKMFSPHSLYRAGL